MENHSVILNELKEAAKVLDNFMSDEKNIADISAAADLITEAIEAGNKVISCGNGGSNCDASHFAEEMLGRFREDRNPYPAIAISDASYLTCVGNDYGYDSVFSRFVKGMGQKGDVLLAITTSGNSKNVVKAIELAKQKGINVIVLTGKHGGQASEYADVEIRVPHSGFADRIQEVHIKIIHILILLIEQKLG